MTICALKTLEYYTDRCNSCLGLNVNRVCYITPEDLRDHMRDFYHLFQVIEEEEELELKLHPEEFDLSG